MIDLGLTKMALIGVVALVVIGPEKLPKVARMAGSLFGRAQRYINEVKSEVSREIELDELRKMQREVEEAAASAGSAIKDTVGQVDADLKDAWHDGMHVDQSTIHNPLIDTPTPASFAVKSKDFRKKRLARTTAMPSWYKHQSGQRIRVISGAARVARYRPSSGKTPSFFS
ncbi:MAG: Sec-independent protein translocase subunit TatB [Herminiimonas sp.]|nr:Sec-independent protein translocase subunit TatB [Herminiimonas sp.]